jgi:hypothetical protein
LSRMWAVAVAATTATMIKNAGKRIFLSWHVICRFPERYHGSIERG